MKSNLLLLLVILSMPIATCAQGTAFNYQGRLTDNSLAANGTYDFVFSVYDAPAGGQILGGPTALDSIAVSAGQFAVPIDFGVGVFSGPGRWLEIGVRVHGAAGAHTILVPRQALLPTPYAIFATSAGNVANGVVSANQLNTGGLAPMAGQFLSYKAGNLFWSDPGVALGDVWSRNGADAYYTAGKIGIGTTAPTTALEVNGIARSTRSGVAPQYIELNGGDSGSIKLTAQSTATAEKNLFIQNLSGESKAGANNNIQFELGTTAAHSTKMTIASNGGVGIGTVTPQTLLHMYEPVGSVSHMIETGGGVNAWARAAFKNLNGTWEIGTSRGFNNDEFYIYRQGASVNSFAIDASGLGVRFAAADLSLGHPTRRGSPGRALVDFTDHLVVNFGDDWGYTSIGGSVTEVKTLRITGGADVAEPFAMPAQIAKGSVVVIDEAHPGQLKLSTEPYDTRVAGVVSGANGINPGIALQQEGALEPGQNVALSGRVYVQADAAFGPIRPGDLLTTSGTPGHAMKVTEHAHAQGAILGKAMSGLKEGQGMVLVLVTLQ